MDIRKIGIPGNVAHRGDSSERADRQPVIVIPAKGRDDARISVAGRETAAAIEGLAERARGDAASREQVVAAAAERLASGQLDHPDVLASTAQKLADARLLSG